MSTFNEETGQSAEPLFDGYEFNNNFLSYMCEMFFVDNNYSFDISKGFFNQTYDIRNLSAIFTNYTEPDCMNLTTDDFQNCTYSNEMTENYSASIVNNMTENSPSEGFAYTPYERLWMAIINGGSNLSGIPCIIALMKYNKDMDIFIGILSFISSTMYHICDGLDVDFYMTEGEWHQIDNISSICCMIGFIINLSYVSKRLKTKLKYIALIIMIILQFADPWNLWNTVVPITIATLFTIFTILIYSKEYRNVSKQIKGSEKVLIDEDKVKIYERRGIIIFPIALFAFFMGLDEHSDYMRLYHSLWHILIGYSTFYIGQVSEYRSYKYETINARIKQEKQNPIHHTNKSDTLVEQLSKSEFSFEEYSNLFFSKRSGMFIHSYIFEENEEQAAKLKQV